MDKANIATPEDRMTFDLVWHQWIPMLNRDRCVVCGELKETILLPATWDRATRTALSDSPYQEPFRGTRRF